jgi:hypothetical protein
MSFVFLVRQSRAVWLQARFGCRELLTALHKVEYYE